MGSRQLAAAGDQSPTDRGRSGERHRVDAWVFHQSDARVAVAEQQGQHTVRQSGLYQRLRQPDGQQRNGAGRFPDHRVAVAERRRDLPRRDRDGEIEGCDDGDGAERTADDLNLLAGRGEAKTSPIARDAFRREETEDLGGSADLSDGLGSGLALLTGQLLAPGIGIAGQHLCRTQEHLAAGRMRGRRPTGKRLRAPATASSTSADWASLPVATTSVGRAGLMSSISAPAPDRQLPLIR